MDVEKRWTTWVSVGAITAVFGVAVWMMLTLSLVETGGTLGAPLDDAWIHYQFARNLAQGNGFSFNPGVPTPGSTAPLWTILLAPIGWFTDDFLLPSLIISGGFLWLTGLVAFGFARWLSDKWWVGLLAGVATVTNGRLLWAGLAGMETTAFAFLSLLAIWRVSQKRLDWLAALLFGLATQLRPEGHALFGLAGLVAVFRISYSDFREEGTANGLRLTDYALRMRHLALPIGIYLLISLPYVIFSLATTGNPLPNTFYAKVGSEYLFSWRTLRETTVIHWQDGSLALLLAAVGLFGAWRRSPLLVGWTVGLPLFTAVVIDQTWHHGRYTMPLIPLVMVLAAVGIFTVSRIPYSVFRKPSTDNGLRIMNYGLRFALGMTFFLASLWTIPRWGEMHGLNAREILEIDVTLGEWLAENTPPDALLAVQDIGAITFLSQREIIDLNGLVSPETWPALNEPGSLSRNQQLARLLSDFQPDYLVGFPLWNWEIVINEQVATAVHSVRTETKTIIFQQDAFVYETHWPYVAEADGEAVVNIPFGEAIRLAEYSVVAEEDVLRLTLFWESVGVEPVAYDLFVHVLDEAGEIVAQADRQPVGGLAATNVWRPGDVVQDEVLIVRPEGVKNGRYTIALGFFNRETGERLPIDHPEAEGGRVGVTAVSW